MRNQVQLIGNIGIDPEVTNFENGAKKVRFTLATNERFKTKDGKEQQKTFWHNLYAWGPTASYIAKSGKKGTQLAITGKLVSNEYQSKAGAKRKFTSIEVQKAVALS
jgi:single-strand DNA-binding protein